MPRPRHVYTDRSVREEIASRVCSLSVDLAVGLCVRKLPRGYARSVWTHMMAIIIMNYLYS